VAANINDYFTKAKERWTGQIGSGGVADASVTTVPFASSTGLPTDTAIYLSVDRVDANGDPTPSKFEVVKVVISGDNGTNAVRGVEGTAQAHSAGAVVEFLATAAAWNSLITGLLVEHNQDGTHSDITADSIEVDGDPVVTLDDAQTLTGKTLTSPVLNGNLTGTGIIDEDDMASDSATKVPTQQSVKAYVDAYSGSADGWTEITDTLTYASATSFTIAGVDRTAVYTKGTRIKLTQTSTKYFVVTSSSFSTNTTVNITAGTDYTLANAAITAPFYSYQANPQGYPGWFNYTPTYAASGSMSFGSVTTNLARFAVTGRVCNVVLQASGTVGGSVSYGLHFTLPITAAQRFSVSGAGVGNTAGTSKSVVVSNYNLNSTTSAEVSIYDVSNWSAGTRDFSVGASYEI